MNGQSVLDKCEKLKVFVIGDVMLDCYWWGKVDRISPEAPVPVINLSGKEERLGGAANVALNVKAMGSETHIYTVIGKDDNGTRIRTLMSSHGIETDGLFQSEKRPTTTKTRIISRNQQIIRIDDEDDKDIQEEHAFIDFVLKGIQRGKPDIIILEDYNKGIFTEHVIHKIIEHGRLMGSFIAVDPKNINFLKYKNVDLFKPNWKEVLLALHDTDEDNYSMEHLMEIHLKLQNELHQKATMITLSERGVFYAEKDDAGIVPAHIRNISDVSGAGDTVISVASLLYFVTGDLKYATEVSNLAGGLVCESVGVVPIDKERLIEEMKKNNLF